MLHYAPQHVSSSTLLILRRTNCITTASGIVTLCKQPYSMQVESGLDATIPFPFHTKSIFYTHMLLSACFWQFHSWNFQIHVTSNSLSCDISVKYMGAGSTPKLPAAGVAATCSMLQKLLVLHWCMAPCAVKMVSVEPGYPDCITGIYICGSELWPVHEPCDISHYLLDRQVWSMLIDGCTSKNVWDAGFSWSDYVTDSDTEAQAQQGWCKLQHRLTWVDGRSQLLNLSDDGWDW